MAFSLKGVHAPHRKNTEGSEPKRIPPVKTVTIPMSMHIGRPAAPILNVGDTVKVGTKIAEAQGLISSPIYSSVSGKITKITDFLTASGTVSQAMVIESDGEMTPDESIAPPTVDSKDSLVTAIRDAGIVGLGGAGFPTHVKFNVDSDKIEYLIINCAECEPYITSDTHTMLHARDDMEFALETIAKYYSIKKVIIGIESNKSSAIESMNSLAERLVGIIDTQRQHKFLRRFGIFNIRNTLFCCQIRPLHHFMIDYSSGCISQIYITDISISQCIKTISKQFKFCAIFRFSSLYVPCGGRYSFSMGLPVISA